MGRGLAALVILWMVRSMTPAAYGILSAAISLSIIASYLCDMGLTHLTIQHLQQRQNDRESVLGTVIRARFILTTGVTIVCGLLIFSLYDDSEQRTVFFILVVPTVWGSALMGLGSTYFWATERMHISALIKLLSQALLALLLIIGILLNWSLPGLAGVYGFTSLAVGLVAAYLMLNEMPTIGRWTQPLLRGIWSYTISGVSGAILPQLGPFLLERASTVEAVGYYAAASRIPAFLYLIPAAVSAAFYPRLFNAYKTDATQHSRLLVSLLQVNTILSLALCFPLALSADLVIAALYGTDYVVCGGRTIRLLCWMVLLNSLSTTFADALTTAERQRARALVSAGALLLGILLFIILGKFSGEVGAAWAAVLTQVTVTIGMMAVNRSSMTLLVNAAKPIWISTAAGLLVSGALFEALPAHIISPMICSVVFLFTILASNRKARHDLRTILLSSRGARHEGGPLQ
jgi:O-antigen/teichoic acid export membrane protein